MALEHKIQPQVQGEKYWRQRKANDKKRDWVDQGNTWIDDYVLSVSHPHRQLIVDALKKFGNIDNVLEIGCNSGPNLLRIAEAYPKLRLSGIDLNKDAIEKAKEVLPDAVFKVASVTNIPFKEKFDVVIADAVLMYVDPQNIKKGLKEIARLSKKGVILVEWFDESMDGVVKDFHWARNYPRLLEKLGYKVTARSLTEQEWPTQKWYTNGQIIVAQSPAR